MTLSCSSMAFFLTAFASSAASEASFAARATRSFSAPGFMPLAARAEALRAFSSDFCSSLFSATLGIVRSL